MEHVHICPHCKQALDKTGECLIAKRKAEKAEAEKLFHEIRNRNWVIKNIKLLLVALASMYGFFAVYLFTASDINETTAGGGIMVMPVLLGLIAALKHINDKKVFKTFYQKYGMNTCLLL